VSTSPTKARSCPVGRPGCSTAAHAAPTDTASDSPLRAVSPKPRAGGSSSPRRLPRPSPFSSARASPLLARSGAVNRRLAARTLRSCRASRCPPGGERPGACRASSNEF
jgi:hypothetical protein